MPDFSMCPGKGCPLKEMCERFIAKPSPNQWYFEALPLIDGRCQYFRPHIDRTLNPYTGERN